MPAWLFSPAVAALRLPLAVARAASVAKTIRITRTSNAGLATSEVSNAFKRVLGNLDTFSCGLE